MIAHPPTLRIIALTFWATGVGRAILDGTVPSMWFWLTLQRDPTAALSYEYPLGAVVWNIIIIALETVGFYVILRHLPVRTGMRTVIATIIGGAASLFALRHVSMDGPGYLYSNRDYLMGAFVCLLMVSIVLLGRYLLNRSLRSLARERSW